MSLLRAQPNNRPACNKAGQIAVRSVPRVAIALRTAAETRVLKRSNPIRIVARVYKHHISRLLHAPPRGFQGRGMTGQLTSNVEPRAPSEREPRGGEQKLRAVYFGGDATNPTLILRINSFLAAGVAVTAFTFRRAKFNTDFQPTWPNIHLGETSDRKYVLRLFPIIRACRVISRHRRAFDGVDFLYARMLDMVLIALFAKLWFRLDAKIVYEVEDVQAIFFQKSLAGAVFRWIERRVLARTQLLVALSPGFLRGYFARRAAIPRALFRAREQDPARRSGRAAERGGKPLAHHPRQMGDRMVRHAAVSAEHGNLWPGLPNGCATGWRFIRAATRPKRGWRTTPGSSIATRIGPTKGEYSIPRDLEEMYGRVHFTWCLDFSGCWGQLGAAAGLPHVSGRLSTARSPWSAKARRWSAFSHRTA